MTNPDRLQGRKTLKVDVIEELEKDEIKRKVDLVALFESFGVSLTKQGTSYVGRCPWHDDTTPSLSVDREKGVYHCFGCGESGDAFTLVQKMKGVGFRDALAYLKNWIGVVPTKTKAANVPTVTNAEPKQEPAAAVPDGLVPNARLLFDVCERYEKALAERPEARAYLEGRTLWVPDALKRFRVGYCDGKLAEVVSADQRDTLEKLGVLKKDGREHFEKCIVVPLFGADGKPTGFYGRRVDDGKPAHLYLPGPHQGLVNREAAKAYRDRLILTEAVLDALSLESLGFHNALPCYGVNGFTNEHEQLLKDERVKEVVLAFDADEAGEKGSRKLQERLSRLGIKSYSIKPKTGKDWNEFLQAGGTKEEIETAIEQAFIDSSHTSGVEIPEVLHSKPEETAGLIVTREKFATIFQSGTVSYRVSGVKELFVANLKVNVRTKADGRDDVLYDTFDLYALRGRSGYAAGVARQFGFEAARVEADLIAILEYLEAERDRKLAGKERPEIVVTPDDRALALAFLESPALFEEIARDMDELGYVGEELNKLLIYLCASSRKLPDPLSVILISQSASGKSYLVDTVKKLMPPEDVIAVTSLSDQALNYIADLLHKFLILGEAVHGDVVEHQIREMLSAKELARLVTLKDPETGKLASKLVRTPAVVASVMSTTDPHINPENASRCFVINTDESKEQTRRIHEAQRKKYTLARYQANGTTVPHIVRKHHAAQRLLKPVAVINEFSRYLDFPDTLMRTRRDHDRFLDLIAAVCFLRQYQKEVKSGNGLAYVECDLADYAVAYNVMVNGVLSSTMVDLPRGSYVLYDAVRELARARAKDEEIRVSEVRLTQREIREATGFGQSWVREHLRRLVEYEYLTLAQGFGRGERARYRLVSDEPIAALDLGMIPSPEAMAVIISKNEK